MTHATAATGYRYHLVDFDAGGRERSGPSGLLGSVAALTEAALTRPTDLFLMCHGWMGDRPAARVQFARWVAAMAECDADLRAIRAARPRGFRPLIVGLHWPSLPFGDERIAPGEAAVGRYADRVADTPEARHALRSILRAAEGGPADLTEELRRAYLRLDGESGLGSAGPAARPGDDRDPFDPRALHQAAVDDLLDDGPAPGPRLVAALLAPLRALSFWRMKDRARVVGEVGAAPLLASLRGLAPAARVHAMGHSFGCVTLAAMLARPGGRRPAPIASLVLVQGALSAWSFAAEVPHAPGAAGYFHAIARDRRVSGPIVATHSPHDLALRRWYPLAAGSGGPVVFASATPKYAAAGTHGLLDSGAASRPILPPDEDYHFAPGSIVNLDAGRVIRRIVDPFRGAHCDYTHPEVAHAVWSAALAGE